MKFKTYLAEAAEEGYVVIYNYGRGNQLLYPIKKDTAQLFSKRDAERLAKKEDRKQGDKIKVHAQPLSRADEFVTRPMSAPDGGRGHRQLENLKLSLSKYGDSDY